MRQTLHAACQSLHPQLSLAYQALASRSAGRCHADDVTARTAEVNAFKHLRRHSHM